MSADRVVYMDSSAIVKLVVRERESAALAAYVRRRKNVVSSALSRVEVRRACLPLGRAARDRAGEVLDRIELIRMSDRVLASAAALLPPDLRSLDAIHLATAGLLGSVLLAVVTYDVRMASAAVALGWRVAAPS